MIIIITKELESFKGTLIMVKDQQLHLYKGHSLIKSFYLIELKKITQDAN